MKKISSFISRVILGIFLSLSVITGFTSCEQPSTAAQQPVFLESFLGTWENNDFNYHSEYEITVSKITDKGMNVVYNVLSQTTITSADGCTLVFCQVAEGSGTQWTPAGNCYAVALKMDGQTLKISCPIDSSSIYTSLDELKAVYTAEYNVAGNNNWFTDFTKM